MCDQQSLRSSCAYAQSDQSLCLSFQYPMRDKLPTEHQLRFLSLKGGCTDLSDSTLVKMPHCWKSRVTAHIYILCPQPWSILILSATSPRRRAFWKCPLVSFLISAEINKYSLLISLILLIYCEDIDKN